MNTSANDDKFKGDIRDAVAEIMAAKEDAERINTIESLLSESQNSINDLTNVISTKEQELAASAEEVDSLKTKVDELEAKTVEFTAQLAEADKTSTELQERASKAELELASIAAEAALSGRMGELDEAKVALAGDSRASQEDKVRGMTNEEFASYKGDRVELRAQLEAELKEAAALAAPKEGSDETKLTAEEVAAQAAAAAAVTLNVETASETTQNAYLGFAKELATHMSGDKE